MSLSNFFGVAASPLFVHVPVVLIAVAGIGAVAVAAGRRVVGIVAGLSGQLGLVCAPEWVAVSRGPVGSDDPRRRFGR